MGREIRRVPMDFDWPLNKVWQGFINPHWKKHCDCLACDRGGYSPDAKFLHEMWYSTQAEQIDFGAWRSYNILAVPDAARLRSMGWNETVIGNIERARRLGLRYLCHWSDKLVEEDIIALVEDGRLLEFKSTFVTGKGWVKKDPPVVPTPDAVNAWSGRGMGHDDINEYCCIRARCMKRKIKIECEVCG